MVNNTKTPVMNLKSYVNQYAHALESNTEFWADKANSYVTWSKPFTNVYNNNFSNDKWFEDGKLNACYNCIDKWVETQPDKTAFIFDDNLGNASKYTYKEAQTKVIHICHAIKHIKAGECITAYLSTSPTAIFVALACARLGIIHNFVFGGFSAESLNLRILDSKSKMVISQEFVARGD